MKATNDRNEADGTFWEWWDSVSPSTRSSWALTRVSLDYVRDGMEKGAKRLTKEMGKALCDLQDEISRLREPPIDGDLISRAIGMLRTRQEFGHVLPDSPPRENCRECAGIESAIETLESLGAAEPPSAPAPTNCKHGKWGKAWVPPDDDPGAPYSRRIEVFKPYKKPFCPDCGARLGTPEGQTE